LAQDKTLELEKKFLAYVLSDNDYIGESIARMDKSYFKHINNIYRMIVGYYDKYKMPITDDRIDAKLNNIKNLTEDEQIKIKTIVSDSRDLPIHDMGEFKSIEDDIITQYKRRKLVKIADKVVGNNPNNCSEEELKQLQDTIQQLLVDINSTDYDVEKEGTVEEDADERLNDYTRIKEHPEEINLIKTGFKHIDEAIIGWGYGSENIVCGRKGDGKSTMLLNLGYYLWKQNKNILFYSLEIDKKQYERRWDARAALVSSKGLKSGQLSEEEEKTYKEYINNLKNHKDMFGKPVGSVYIVDCPSNVTPSFVSAKTEEIEKKTGIVYDVVIVDYMGIMNANMPTGVIRDDLGSIALDLKRFAREQKKVLFTAVQMNRSGKKDLEQKNGHADTDAIAGSDQIADHADNVFVIRSLDSDTALVESSKTRDGSSFSFHIQKKYDKMQMIEIDDSEWDNL
jgi:replicative DNA helicase